MSRRHSIPFVGAMIAVAVTIGGCSTKEGNAGDSAKASTTGNATIAPAARSADSSKASAVASRDSGSMAGMAGTSTMTGDPDHGFLGMMSDHHKGLILMVHQTVDSKEKLGVKPFASRLDKEQDAEMDKMMTMLEKDFKDSYAPKTMPEHQAMADELKGKTGADYDRAFLTDVTKHHEEAIKMIDDYLPNAKQPALKRMAETMKATRLKEIAEMRAKLASATP